ncbi:dUTP diphosphatase [Paenibacillus larvae]|uniref:dUTP diphosphatase n=1 Tax=Paenibacillus larvae subsp. larvae DSM 25430 TaxID=697284 RepID=V9W9A2_9BACL|nr:dUTP diphosphatase [Paenibacillus larvae]AHD06474.1 deoxyuridine 5'-triphosphate nucleotidohydrolase Dut [Paenibacillus larvae subsp. larvae DSM 25430]AVG13022.1 deoxyuridine 5'-triphosphate nucleotidohydrolase Dut [Paenibacillus larvae subsp. larvae DSM 25430]MDR5568982.1 dUTP diphosphatase [Paenibacillus larvae]MDR5596740.1 dUTP diphosphatase [Paenibacillus larvae]
MEIKIKKIHPDAVIPEYATAGAAGFDLVALEDVIIEPGDVKTIRTGLAFEIPVGYELQIRPRSGVSLKTKLRQPNSVGTIDSDYRGEVQLMFENTLTKLAHLNVKLASYLIQKGDRLAQGIIAPVERAKFTVVDELSGTERGAGGFGHTGVQ